MKIQTFLWAGIFTAFIFSSCKKLDNDFVTQTTRKQITERYDNLNSLVTGVYSSLPEGFVYIDGAMMAAATDEAEFTLETSAIQKFNTGSWNAYTNPDDVWSKYFTAIRRSNFFLENSDSVRMDFYKLDPDPGQQSVYKTRQADILRWKYEVRFLRAFYYFELIKRYGGIPIITKTLPIDVAPQDVKRNTLAECITFISDECNDVANNLVQLNTNAELGRVTKAAALALKSRLLLYAASDLFNTTSWAAGFGNPELISLTGDRSARWKAAADAAKAVIDLSGPVSLTTGYRALFNTFNNTEIIMTRRNTASNNFEIASFPIGFNLGKSGTTPSQNLVDAYEMTDGSKFDWNNPVQAASPYLNRDPRLGMTVITNNSSFGTSTIANGGSTGPRNVEIWTGGRDGKGIALATKTGYYLKKYTDESLNLLTNKTSVHSWIIFRLPEMYLNYAEALNEYNPGNADIKKFVDLVRSRTGVNMPPLPAGLSQTAMRDRIRNERRIEFAFEDHRFWDIRRWMQGPEYLGAPLQGVDIVKTGTNTFTYQKITIESRVFLPKMYLYPVPQSEIVISNGTWTQNPLW